MRENGVSTERQEPRYAGVYSQGLLTRRERQLQQNIISHMKLMQLNFISLIVLFVLIDRFILIYDQYKHLEFIPVLCLHTLKEH